jgi:hypothetical protein
MRGALRIVLTLAYTLAFVLPVFADQKTVDAPVDEYFGRQKISTLGIDNMIRDTDQQESSDPTMAPRLYGGLITAEDALEDWAVKYPHDSWIPKRAYEMSHLFWRMHSAEANVAADRCRELLFKQFPSSRYAALAHVETPSMTAADPWQRFLRRR